MTRYDNSTRRRRLKKLRLTEISLVDQPAHGPARVAITKRKADTPGVEAPTQKQLGSRMAVTTPADGHAHTVMLVHGNSEGMQELRSGQTSFADGHVHDWVMDDAGNIVITDVNGHTHGIGVLVTKADVDMGEDELAEGVLAALGAENPDAGTTAEEFGTSSEDHTMTQKNDQAANDKTPAVTQDQLDAAQKRAERAEQIVKLTPDQRAHFDGLPEGEQDEFLSASDKDAIVKNANDANKVVYVDLDGNEFRKSDDKRMIDAAKRADKAEKRAAAQELAAKRATFEKRANEELSHLPGETSAKAALLEAVEGIKDESLRDDALEILKSKDAGLSKAFTAVGTQDSTDGDGRDPNEVIEGIAKSIREKSPDLSPEQAYVAALDTPEGREAFAQTRS